MQYNTVLHRCQICWTLVLGRIQGYCTDSTEHPLASLHSSQCACCCCCSNKTYDLDPEPTANTLALTMRNFIIFQYHALLTHFNVLKTLVQIDGVIIRCSYFLANFDTVTWIISSYRVSHIIGPTLFFCNFSGSGAPTEELFTIFQQPWKFATL